MRQDAKTNLRERHRRIFCSAGCCLLYLVSTVGVPLNLLGGHPSMGCQCSSELKSSGKCCCRAAGGTGVARSCCAMAVKSCCPAAKQGEGAVKSCCSGRSSETAADASDGMGRRTRSNDELPAFSACSCGQGPIWGVMANSDPRLPGSVSSFDDAETPVEPVWQRPSCWDFFSPAPETPPPEFQAA